REGVKFHDGSPLTAHEVAGSFERQLKPEAQGANRTWPALLRGAPGVIKEVRAPNSRTVEIVLAQPYAPLLTVLAHPGLSIAKPSSAADGAGRLIGTGPYRVVDASVGRLALEAMPGYWAGPPKSERLVFLDVSAEDQADPPGAGGDDASQPAQAGRDDPAAPGLGRSTPQYSGRVGGNRSLAPAGGGLRHGPDGGDGGRR